MFFYNLLVLFVVKLIVLRESGDHCGIFALINPVMLPNPIVINLTDRDYDRMDDVYTWTTSSRISNRISNIL